MEGAVIESVLTQHLHVLLILLECRKMGPGDVHLGRDTAGTITRKSVSGHAAVGDTPARQTRDVGDPGNGSTVLADPREGHRESAHPPELIQ
jgi:hypothetical protein